ncbi:MAG TPA: peptide MFS transporter [Thermoanaerobaculia bacterium]|nr:peptide MFS transporter [Thermoanaerobaculia bacterium]
MSTAIAAVPPAEKHPRGLYVLFLTEMWERFSFYTVGAMYVLYVQDAAQGFGWTRDQATTVFSFYLMFVYASPLVGGLLADLKLGYRRSVMIGGFFFMAGHGLLAFRNIPVMYAALACLVIGNGFFKPNVSTMVGNLYPEGSHLKDRAYNIFYMGINVGAFLAPLVAEYMKGKFGFHPAFAMGALGMVISVSILWFFRREVAGADKKPDRTRQLTALERRPIDDVSDARRVGALIVMFVVVIVFWMIFHQNQVALTYWANENTAWNVTGIISNAINPGWVLLLTVPLIAFWSFLDRRGKEPSTPTKMAIGMVLTGLAFYVLYFAGKAGGDVGKVSPWWLIGAYGVLTLGELMLSPMGLSLVSKVAPIRYRGLLMGGWFVAIAVGNKLTAIAVFWDEWLHSTFFAVLGTSAIVMSLVLLVLLKPLKRAMPGI